MRQILIVIYLQIKARKPDGVSPQAIEPDRKKRRNPEGLRLYKSLIYLNILLRGQDLNLRPSGYEPDISGGKPKANRRIASVSPYANLA